MLEMLPLPEAEPESPKEPTAAPSPGTPVRLLTEEEIQTLAPVFEQQGAVLPDPSTSFFVGSVDDSGSVCSFLVVQLRVHAEPMWIKPGHEGTFRSLVHTAESIIAERTGGGCDVFLFTPAGKIARLAEVAGMRQEPWTVYSKHISPTEPPQPDPEPEPIAAVKPKRVPVWQRPPQETLQ